MTLYRILGIAVLFVIALTVADRCHRASVADWEARVERLNGEVEAEKRATEAAKLEAAEKDAEADSLRDELARRAPEIRERIIRVQAETPDHLRSEPAVLWRDSIIADLRNEADGWRKAYKLQQAAYVELQGALRRVEASRDSLLTAVIERPGERPWYLPRIGAGPFVGLCADGKPCAGPVSVNVSWEIKL